MAFNDGAKRVHFINVMKSSKDFAGEHLSPISESDVVSEFAKKHRCKLQVLEHGEHYFHTDQQLHYFKQWLKDRVSCSLRS